MDNKRDVWVEVDLEAIKHNVNQVRSFIGGNVLLMAVVKADAYGHGAVETSKAMLEAGADALAVTRLDEARRLRNGGINAPLLVFDSLQPSLAEEIVSLGLEATICTPELTSALGKAACAAHRTINVHIKIDTGMGRQGVLPEDAVSLTRTVMATEGLILAGTYTHFATAAEKDLRRTKEQLGRFNTAILEIERAFHSPGIVHAANSAAMLRLPESHFGMVRPGTILYGQYPSRYVPQKLDLKNTWQLKSRISFVKTVPAGYHIGYGAEFKTKRESKIAVIPIGWVDGLTLIPESVARRGILRLAALRAFHKPALRVTIKGRKAPVVGRVAMQMCSIDVTRVQDASIGDEVTIPTRRVTLNPDIPRVYTG